MYIEILSSNKINRAIFKQIKSLLVSLYPNRKLTFRNFVATLKENRTVVFVALSENHIVGTALLSCRRRWFGELWEIDDVVVGELMRGKGTGKLLNEAMIKHVQSKGALCVDVATRHPDALPFYKALGFKEKREQGFYAALRYEFKK